MLLKTQCRVKQNTKDLKCIDTLKTIVVNFVINDDWTFFPVNYINIQLSILINNLSMVPNKNIIQIILWRITVSVALIQLQLSQISL